MNEESDSINERVKNALKLFGGITETLSNVLQPPRELMPEKQAIYLCLGIGTMGAVALAYVKAPWYAYATEVFLVATVAFLLGRK
jgi:hypothetical protein